jgi:hypothetical protein
VATQRRAKDLAEDAVRAHDAMEGERDAVIGQRDAAEARAKHAEARCLDAERSSKEFEVGLYKLNPVVTHPGSIPGRSTFLPDHSLKAPGFNPYNSNVISWFQKLPANGSTCTATWR